MTNRWLQHGSATWCYLGQMCGAVTSVEGSTVHRTNGTLSFSHELLPSLAASGLTFFLQITWEGRQSGAGCCDLYPVASMWFVYGCGGCTVLMPACGTRQGVGWCKGVRGREQVWVLGQNTPAL